MTQFTVNAWAATEQGGKFSEFEYDLPELGPEQVDIAVDHCGLCHSDLSLRDNEWGNAQYPLVPGHEVIGRIIRAGDAVKGVAVGDSVGLGWFSGSCMHCHPCMSGNHHLCGDGEQTIVGRHGGFADTVRAHWSWAIPLPTGIDVAKAGPLFCGGITVFSPIILAGVQPTNRVGVIGIGGLGHMALQFLNKWGCEVTAFTSTEAKADEARRLGAHHVVNSRDSQAMKKIAGSLDFILNTTNVALDWASYIMALAPKGRLHTVGAVLEPMPIAAFSLIGGEKSVGGSPLGSPAVTRKMLEFCARHDIHPVTESFAMNDINAAFDRLEAGDARYRIVLSN